jgi:amino acid transporter
MTTSVTQPDETHATTGEPSLERVMGPGLLLLFIVGDILGTGIYALTGQVAKQVGGVVWLPFVVAFAVALVTGLQLPGARHEVPQGRGAALYTHKAFGIHFVTFIVAFAVMCSGITSASTASAPSPPTCRTPSASTSRRHRHHARSASPSWRWSRRSTSAASARA